jgi:pimeloyl-ACP methyl ester carboxylesterase
MGGMTAMMFALDHPEQISKLVLVSTSVKTSTSISMMLWVLIHALPYSIFADGSVDFKYYEPSKQIKNEAVDRALKTPNMRLVKASGNSVLTMTSRIKFQILGYRR